MNAKEKYRYRIEHNLCGLCGKPKQEKYATCDYCREQQRETKLRYMRYGVCPICKKYPIMGDEKMCPECRVKNIERVANYRNKNREKCREAKRISSVKRAKRLKGAGICPRCGKRKSDGIRITCGFCREKERIAYSSRRKKIN